MCKLIWLFIISQFISIILLSNNFPLNSTKHSERNFVLDHKLNGVGHSLDAADNEIYNCYLTNAVTRTIVSFSGRNCWDSRASQFQSRLLMDSWIQTMPDSMALAFIFFVSSHLIPRNNSKQRPHEVNKSMPTGCLKAEFSLAQQLAPF